MKLICMNQTLIGEWTASKVGGTWCPTLAQAIGLVEVSDDGLEGRVIAGAIFSDWNTRSCQVHLAGEPGARWMTKEYLGFCFQYAFNQLGVTKLLGFVGEGNLDARRFDEHIGFTLDATIHDAHPTGDLLIYSMTRDQCKWLNIQVRKEAFYEQRFCATSTGLRSSSDCAGSGEQGNSPV